MYTCTLYYIYKYIYKYIYMYEYIYIYIYICIYGAASLIKIGDVMGGEINFEGLCLTITESIWKSTVFNTPFQFQQIC